MRAFAVDTLELSEKFHKAGITQKASKVLASEIKTAQENSIGNLVTKNDLKLVQKDIVALEDKIDERFNTVRQEIKSSMLIAIMSIGGMITVATTVIGFLIKF